MKRNDDGSATRGASEVRGRIADILGYCNLDGKLHKPEEFEKKLLRSKWVCPDCNTVAGKVAYKRAVELEWMLVTRGPEEKKKTENPSKNKEQAAEDDEEAAESETDDEGPKTGETDSEDVKARIENAQEDIEEFEEAAEQ